LRFSAKGAALFKAWGIAPGKFIGSNTSAESAIHFGLSAWPKLNRAFQRWGFGSL
jgi:hypothetical protein